MESVIVVPQQHQIWLLLKLCQTALWTSIWNQTFALTFSCRTQLIPHNGLWVQST